MYASHRRIHLDLIVDRKFVHEKHMFEPTRIVNHDLCDRKIEFILGTSLIEIMKVNTIQIFLFFLVTGTMLASQSGCCFSLMNLDSMSFLISDSMDSIIS